MKKMSLSGTPMALSSSTRMGRYTLGCCHRRVVSQVTMQTFSPGLTISLSLGVPIGFARASRTASSSVGAQGTSRLRRTPKRSESGISTSTTSLSNFI